jgi:tetratricopeptide (TPR) repeat protein
VIGCMQGLRTLYDHTGHVAEWARLVDEIVPDLVDPDTGGPRLGLAEQWGLLTHYQVAIAQAGRNWTAALRLQQARVDHARQEAATALATAPDRLTGADRNRIRTLSISEQNLGHILREQKDPGCVTHYVRAADLARAIRNRRGECVVAFNLGHAHLDIPSLRDLDRAEHWYRRALDLMEAKDRLSQARAVGQLGTVARERFLDARASGQPEPVLLEHLNAAAAAYRNALDLLPADALPDIATAHHQLGVVYTNTADDDTALTHYQQAIRLWEVAGNRYNAGTSRHALAVLFANTGRAGDALLYAGAALADFAPYGASAAADIERVQQFIAQLNPPAKPTPTEAP